MLRRNTCTAYSCYRSHQDKNKKKFEAKKKKFVDIEDHKTKKKLTKDNKKSWSLHAKKHEKIPIKAYKAWKERWYTDGGSSSGKNDDNTSRGEKDGVQEKDVSIVTTKKKTKHKVQGFLDPSLAPVNNKHQCNSIFYWIIKCDCSPLFNVGGHVSLHLIITNFDQFELPGMQFPEGLWSGNLKHLLGLC